MAQPLEKRSKRSRQNSIGSNIAEARAEAQAKNEYDFAFNTLLSGYEVTSLAVDLTNAPHKSPYFDLQYNTTMDDPSLPFGSIVPGFSGSCKPSVRLSNGLSHICGWQCGNTNPTMNFVDPDILGALHHYATPRAGNITGTPAGAWSSFHGGQLLIYDMVDNNAPFKNGRKTFKALDAPTLLQDLSNRVGKTFSLQPTSAFCLNRAVIKMDDNRRLGSQHLNLLLENISAGDSFVLFNLPDEDLRVFCKSVAPEVEEITASLFTPNVYWCAGVPKSRWFLNGMAVEAGNNEYYLEKAVLFVQRPLRRQARPQGRREFSSSLFEAQRNEELLESKSDGDFDDDVEIDDMDL